MTQQKQVEMYPDRFKQFIPQEAQFQYCDGYEQRPRFYQENSENRSITQQMRGISPSAYKNNKYREYHANPYMNQTVPQRYNHYPKYYHQEQQFENQFNYIDSINNAHVKYESSGPNNPYLQKEFPIDLSKYVPIHVHNSMIRHYQSSLHMIKSQNNALIKKLKIQSQKMHQLYEFTQKIVSCSQKDSNHFQDPNFETQQTRDSKSFSFEKNVLTPAKILQNKIRSLNQKKALQQKVKVQTTQRNSLQTNYFQNDRFDDQFYGQQSFLVDETVQIMENQKKIIFNGPKANTFGIRKHQDEFNEKNVQPGIQENTKNEEHKFEFNFIEEFLNDYLCQKIAYVQKREFNNAKISKKDLVNHFLKWRLESKGSINGNIDRNIIEHYIVEQFQKRFNSCRADSMSLIGLIFKDSKFNNAHK